MKKGKYISNIKAKREKKAKRGHEENKIQTKVDIDCKNKEFNFFSERKWISAWLAFTENW